MSASRLRCDTFSDYMYIAKSLIWDNPIKIDEGIYLGNATHSFSTHVINEYNITGIINATKQIGNFHKNIEYLNINIDDNDDADLTNYFQTSYNFMSKHQLAGGSVLVHCLFGRSRSVAICIYYLIKKYDWNFDLAYQYLSEKKHFINLNYNFYQQLIECTDDLISSKIKTRKTSFPSLDAKIKSDVAFLLEID